MLVKLLETRALGIVMADRELPGQPLLLPVPERGFITAEELTSSLREIVGLLR